MNDIFSIVLENLFVLPIIFMWLLVALICYLYFKPKREIINKYGKPLKYFRFLKCVDGIPVSRTRIALYFYPNFVVVEDVDKEYILDRSFRNFRFVNRFPYLIFEVLLDGKIRREVSISIRHKKYLKKFFGQI